MPLRDVVLTKARRPIQEGCLVGTRCTPRPDILYKGGASLGRLAWLTLTSRNFVEGGEEVERSLRASLLVGT